MAIKGLIFDLDGTVTITQQYHAQTFAAVFKKHGLKYTARDDARYSGRGSHCTFPEFFKEHGIILTKKQIEEYSKEKRILYDKLIKTAHLKNVPGIETFLEKQKAKGIKIAMATGNRIDAARLILKKTGLLKYFKIIVTNKDVKNSKPFPDIFLKAAEKLNLKPQECIVFEDAVNGVEAAKNGGMRCIALTTGTPAEKLRAAGADHLIANYRRVNPEFLQ
jgi:beta-phosphoglucomutase